MVVTPGGYARVFTCGAAGVLPRIPYAPPLPSPTSQTESAHVSSARIPSRQVAGVQCGRWEASGRQVCGSAAGCGGQVARARKCPNKPCLLGGYTITEKTSVMLPATPVRQATGNNEAGWANTPARPRASAEAPAACQRGDATQAGARTARGASALLPPAAGGSSVRVPAQCSGSRRSAQWRKRQRVDPACPPKTCCQRTARHAVRVL